MPRIEDNDTNEFRGENAEIEDEDDDPVVRIPNAVCLN